MKCLHSFEYIWTAQFKQKKITTGINFGTKKNILSTIYNGLKETTYLFKEYIPLFIINILI